MKVLLGLGGWQDAGLLPSSGAQVTLVALDAQLGSHHPRKQTAEEFEISIS